MTTIPKTVGRSGEPRLASIASWAVLAASFALSASTWIAMAVLAGFTSAATLPVIGVTLKVAWLMPVAIDGYVVVALVLWMSNVPATVAEFAKKNTYGAAGIGVAAQSAYHLLMTQSETNQSWRVVLAAVVGALPPAVAALAVHMRALIRRETDRTTVASGTTPATKPTVPAPAATPITVAVSTLPTVPAPSITAPRPADPRPTEEPTTTPEPVPGTRTEPVPTPAEVAARVTPSPTSIPPRPTATRPATAGVSKPRPRKTAPTAPVRPLAASAADTPVTEPKPAQLPLPLPADPALLAKARETAAQYRTENGTPITANQLAARLRVNSEQATQALAVLNLGPDNPTTPLPTANGRPVKAAR
ncbi:hypothetical protein ACIA5C_48135 [Actinoplanes sp. NPDC051343]|uniref:hypothetical protein n=1 Tax=Actinoplanes sp. NPDC051343 TaxID=3363906 RepID=UPI0037B6BB35